MKKTIDMNIAVLMGGNSPEREISLKSGFAIIEALKDRVSNVFSVDPIKPDWISKLSGVDFVFIALHGSFGEDGRVQGLLELKNIPYSGTGVLGSALGMDKLRAKQLWKGIGVSTPEFYQIDETTDFKRIIDKSKLSYQDIKNLYFFSSKRWDLELKNNVLIKLSKNHIEDSLDLASEFLNNKNFEGVKIIDTRIKDQIILNG